MSTRRVAVARVRGAGQRNLAPARARHGMSDARRAREQETQCMADAEECPTLLHIAERQQVELLRTLFRLCLVIITHPQHIDM